MYLFAFSLRHILVAFFFVLFALGGSTWYPQEDEKEARRKWLKTRWTDSGAKEARETLAEWYGEE